jgi:glycosyltransferase involved in cell wall biosynthesis
VDNYFEGFGMVVHELSGAGLPVLVGNSGGTADACAGEWSVLLDPEDVGAWVAEIERLALDEPLRHRLAVEAHRWAAGIDEAETARELRAVIRGD